MATQLSNNLITIFDSEVKHIYQSEGFMLANTVRKKTGNGKTFKFPVYGSLRAEEHVPGQDANIQNATQRQATVIAMDRRVVSATDKFENLQVNYDDRQEAARAQAMAMGRDSDQMIINALESSTTLNTVAEAGAGLTLAKLKSAVEMLEKAEIDLGACTYLGTYKQKMELLEEIKATSADYVSSRPLETGNFDGFLGIGKFIWIGERAEGGLAKEGNARSNFLWHHDSVGLGEVLNVQSRTDWDAKMGADLVQSYYSAGAGEIDPTGIVKISCVEA
jgi:hypothetical protein